MLEQRLLETVSSVEGVGKAKVMIDPSALDIPEAGDKIAQSGLAAAGGTYHGGGAAGGDCKAHMIDL